MLENVPELQDIKVTLRLLQSLGARPKFEENTVRLSTPEIIGTEAPYSLVKALRASFWALGPLVARAGEARVSLPGGDAIGTRPVDLHLKGLVKLGADVRMQHGVVVASAPQGLRGAVIELDYPSVGATHNLLMAAALIAGESVIKGAAREPEVVELASFLSQMGAEIVGAGSDVIQIKGRRQLGGARHAVIGDRIEAVTYLLGGVVTGGDVEVRGVEPEAIQSTLQVLQAAGCEVICRAEGIRVTASERLKAVTFATAPYPGVATDVQPLLMAALCRARGESVITETVFENRFGHAAEYRRFGVDIDVEGDVAKITGVPTLSSAPVQALDIRAAAGVLLMGLMAEGETRIFELYHLDRGYENLVGKLKALGADVKRVSFDNDEEFVLGC